MTAGDANPLTRDHLDAKLGEFKAELKLWLVQCVVIQTIIQTVAILGAFALMLDHIRH